MKTLQTLFRPAVGLATGMFLWTAAPSGAQSDLETALEQYGRDTVEGYIKPLADLFGANMHAGYYHSAKIGTLKPSVEISIIGMASSVSDDQKSYTASAPEGFAPATYTTATVFGGKGATIRHATVPGLQHKGSDGIVDASFFPLAVPQVSASIMGTEGIVRFMKTPSIDSDTFPETTLMGLGLRHSVSQYIPLFPVDVAVGAFYNSFTAGDLIDFKGYAFGVQASKGIGPLTGYGGLALEKSTMNVSYTSEADLLAGTVDLDIDGDNSFRLTLGGRFSLAVLRIFADLNIGSVTNFSGGLAFGI